MMTEKESWEEVKRRLNEDSLYGSYLCRLLNSLYEEGLINLDIYHKLQDKIDAYRAKYLISTTFFYPRSWESNGLKRRLELIDSFIGGYDVPYKGYDK